MTGYAVEIQNLTKTYRAKGKSPPKIALDSIDLVIPKGSIFGLLGPNGAGKSTIINILAGLVTKTSGTVRIWDINIDDDMRRAYVFGFVPVENFGAEFCEPLGHAPVDLEGDGSADRRLHRPERQGARRVQN